eukprot:sb/3472270/
MPLYRFYEASDTNTCVVCHDALPIINFDPLNTIPIIGKLKKVSDSDLVPPDLVTPRLSDRINFPRYRKLTIFDPDLSDSDLVPPDLVTPRLSDRINFPRYRKLTIFDPDLETKTLSPEDVTKSGSDCSLEQKLIEISSPESLPYLMHNAYTRCSFWIFTSVGLYPEKS